MGQKYTYPDFSSWKKDAIKTTYGITVAPEDFYVHCNTGKKEYFTWAEAMEYEKRILRPNGWRLPTRGEWARITEEFNTTEQLLQHLHLRLNGFVSWKDMDLYDLSLDPHLVNYRNGSGCYWSSSDASFPYKYSLHFNFSVVNPSKCNYLGYRYSIRCVSLKKSLRPTQV